jgi:hypothetical protein
MSASVVACGALALDVRRIGARRGWHVDVVPVAALLHNRPDRIASAVGEASRGRDVATVAYGDCGTAGALDGLPRLRGDSCYDVLGREEVRAPWIASPEPTF